MASIPYLRNNFERIGHLRMLLEDIGDIAVEAFEKFLCQFLMAASETLFAVRIKQAMAVAYVLASDRWGPL